MPAGDTWYPGVTPMMGIGQGYTAVTPLQDIRWLDAVATGSLVTPTWGSTSPATAGTTALTHLAAASLPFAAQLGPVDVGLALEVTEGTGTMLQNLPAAGRREDGHGPGPVRAHGGPDAWYDAVYPVHDPQVVVLCAVHGGGQGYYDCEPSVDQLLQYFAANQAGSCRRRRSRPPARCRSRTAPRRRRRHRPSRHGGHAPPSSPARPSPVAPAAAAETASGRSTRR